MKEKQTQLYINWFKIEGHTNNASNVLNSSHYVCKFTI